MIGITRIVCATTIAAGREQDAERAERPRAREQQIDEQPDDDRRQAHERVERHDHHLPPRKALDRDRSAQRQADPVAAATAVRLTCRLSARCRTASRPPRDETRGLGECRSYVAHSDLCAVCWDAIDKTRL